MSGAYSYPHVGPGSYGRVGAAATSGRFLDFASFGAPALIFVQLAVVGQLFLSELILLALLPFVLVARDGRPFDRVARVVVFLGLLWLWGQVVTDIYRGAAFHDYARGWMKISFTLTNFVAIYAILDGRTRRLLLFSCGLALGMIVQVYADPSPYSIADPWKFGFAFPVTLFIAVGACGRRASNVPFLEALALGAAALLNLLLGFRSLGGVCMLSAVYLAVNQVRSRQWHTQVRLTVFRAAALGLVSIALVVGVLASYGSAAKDGLLGDVAAHKYEQQSSGRFGVLLAGRPEIFGALQAIKDSPIIGHGSWARDPKYTYEMLAELRRFGYVAIPPAPENFDLIPTHSHLLGAWVESGILGAVFWVAMLALAGSVIANLYRVRLRVTPLIAFLTFLFVWDIGFSPYGAQARVIAPFSIFVLVQARLLLRRTLAPGNRDASGLTPALTEGDA